jgi:hypothetical protein
VHAAPSLSHEGASAAGGEIQDKGEIRVRIGDMIVAIFAMRVLETMFFVGLAGSAIVVAISFIEDGKELFGKNEE